MSTGYKIGKDDSAYYLTKAEDYLYSSARCYAGMSGPLEVIPLDFTWKTYR